MQWTPGRQHTEHGFVSSTRRDLTGLSDLDRDFPLSFISKNREDDLSSDQVLLKH